MSIKRMLGIVLVSISAAWASTLVLKSLVRNVRIVEKELDRDR